MKHVVGLIILSLVAPPSSYAGNPLFSSITQENNNREISVQKFSPAMVNVEHKDATTSFLNNSPLSETTKKEHEEPAIQLFYDRYEVRQQNETKSTRFWFLKLTNTVTREILTIALPDVRKTHHYKESIEDTGRNLYFHRQSAPLKEPESEEAAPPDLFAKIEDWVKEGKSWDEIKENTINFFQPHQDSHSESGEKSTLPTDRKIADYLWKNFSYDTDQRLFGKEEHVQNPLEFLRNKKGDCEDFSILASEFFKLHGISSFVLNVYGQQFAHSVTVYKKDKFYRVLDGPKVKKIKAENVTELLSQIYPFWVKGLIMQFSPTMHKSKVLKEIKRAKE